MESREEYDRELIRLGASGWSVRHLREVETSVEEIRRDLAAVPWWRLLKRIGLCTRLSQLRAMDATWRLQVDDEIMRAGGWDVRRTKDR